MLTGPQDIAIKLPRSLKGVGLGVSLVLSAMLTAVALRLPDYHWLAWISFLPLFVAVRSLRPTAAALAGGLWGGCLYAFFMAAPTPPLAATALVVNPAPAAIGSSLWLLALLIVIPAVYVGLAALYVRAIGFCLLTLALGWSVIEATLHLHSLYGPHDGLLTGSVGEGHHPHWFARLLGYVSTAFLVACVNASLVGLLGNARLSFPAERSLEGARNAVGRVLSQVVVTIESWTLRQAYPRAPPIPPTMPS
ncbi:MAG: hypothetical protein ACYTFA_14565 [Planctomycetota bacterium]